MKELKQKQRKSLPNEYKKQNKVKHFDFNPNITDKGTEHYRSYLLKSQPTDK